MLLLGTKNTTVQTVLTDGTVNLGMVYRRYCKKNRCGIPAFSRTSQDITLNHSGIYHLTMTAVASGTAAGTATLQLFVNGEAVEGAISSETITTADTELRTFVIDYYIIVDKNCVLGVEANSPNTISIVNTGVGTTISSIIVNIDKVV